MTDVKNGIPEEPIEPSTGQPEATNGPILPLINRIIEESSRQAHEEMSNRPPLEMHLMDLPFSLQKSALGDIPRITFTSYNKRDNRWVLEANVLDDNRKFAMREYEFQDGQTRRFQPVGKLSFTITCKNGSFYYSGPDLTIVKMVR